MSKHLLGGLVLAAFFAPIAALAAPASPPIPSSPARHPRGSFFTSNENRGDVPARIERMFRKLDTNHDGFVAKTEITALQGQFEQRASKSAPRRAAHLFENLDADRDGQITQEEIDSSRAKRLAATGKTAKASHRGGASLFGRADANKDGVITRAEFDGAVADGKITLRHAAMRGSQIVRLFDRADTDRDGRLSLDEAKQAALRQFDAADLDHDGELTPAERRQAAKAARKRPAA